jgi:transposase
MVCKLKEKNTQKLTRLVKEISSKKFPYEAKEEKSIDWNAYNAAQINEINDYLVLIKEIVDELKINTGSFQNSTGRPSKDCYDKAKALLVQQYFECSNRVAAGLIKLFKEKLGIEENIAYKDIERAYEDACVITILKLVLELSNNPIKDKETDFSIDGSGMHRTIKNNYESDKSKGKDISKYDKFVGVMGSKYQLYSAVDITDGEANECPFLIPLMGETKKLYDRIDLVTADAAYLSRANCSYVKSIGAFPRIFPKINTTLNAEGSFAWKYMLLDFIRHTQKWLRDYHKRSISETGNSVLKTRFPRPLLKRVNCRRKVETFSRICCYNLRRLVYINYLMDVDVRWLTGG